MHQDIQKLLLDFDHKLIIDETCLQLRERFEYILDKNKIDCEVYCDRKVIPLDLLSKNKILIRLYPKDLREKRILIDELLCPNSNIKINYELLGFIEITYLVFEIKMKQEVEDDGN